MKIKIRVLVVDDDRSTLEIYQESMTLAGLEVTTASNGTDAFLLSQKHHFDVVFTGIEMSGMDGFSLIEKIRSEMRENTPFFIINSHIDRDEDRKRSQNLGIDGYFVRGFSAPIKVVQHIKELVANKKQEVSYTKEQFEKAVKEEVSRRTSYPKQSTRKIILFSAIISSLSTVIILVLFWWIFLEVFSKSVKDEKEFPIVPQNVESSTFQNEESIQEEPIVGTLSGTVIGKDMDAIRVSVDSNGDGVYTTVKVNTGDSQKNGITKTLGTLQEVGGQTIFKETGTKKIGFQEVAEGDSIAFVLSGDVFVSEVESGEAVLVAESVFVGPPAKDIKE
ncbi:MAG: response regulator [Candidatus Moraniibacteriota bacterium]|nr:MAG: response regulator [Candidatus Moranbacteria bacterium]